MEEGIGLVSAAKPWEAHTHKAHTDKKRTHMWRHTIFNAYYSMTQTQREINSTKTAQVKNQHTFTHMHTHTGLSSP